MQLGSQLDTKSVDLGIQAYLEDWKASTYCFLIYLIYFLIGHIIFLFKLENLGSERLNNMTNIQPRSSRVEFELETISFRRTSSFIIHIVYQ